MSTCKHPDPVCSYTWDKQNCWGPLRHFVAKAAPGGICSVMCDYHAKVGTYIQPDDSVHKLWTEVTHAANEEIINGWFVVRDRSVTSKYSAYKCVSCSQFMQGVIGFAYPNKDYAGIKHLSCAVKDGNVPAIVSPIKIQDSAHVYDPLGYTISYQGTCPIIPCPELTP